MAASPFDTPPTTKTLLSADGSQVLYNWHIIGQQSVRNIFRLVAPSRTLTFTQASGRLTSGGRYGIYEVRLENEDRALKAGDGKALVRECKQQITTAMRAYFSSQAMQPQPKVQVIVPWDEVRFTPLDRLYDHRYWFLGAAIAAVAAVGYYMQYYMHDAL